MRPEDIVRAALSACNPIELSLAINVAGALTRDVDPTTNPGLVNLWRSVATAAKAEIANRPIHDLISQDELDSLNAPWEDDPGDAG